MLYFIVLLKKLRHNQIKHLSLKTHSQFARAEITQTISPKKDTISLGEALQTITSGLKEGQKITIEGFATFYTVEKPEREGRNPRTGKPAIFRASRRPKMEFDKEFLNSVNYDESASDETPSPSPSPAPNPEPIMVSVTPPASAAPVAAPVLPPPIPPELIAAAASGSESKWQIKAPNGGFVEISTRQFADWGVGELTPVYSMTTGWRLAGQVPELLGFIVK
jgi:DNA-binding protein HU-beta